MPSAAALKIRDFDDTPTSAYGWSGMRLFTLLSSAAVRHPHQQAVVDQVDREAWSGRPSRTLTYQGVMSASEKMARVFAGLKIQKEAPIGVLLPGGTEAYVTLLAIERAGLTPCLLPLGARDEELKSVVETLGLQAIVTQTQIADDRPTERICDLAASFFGLRFIFAYGPNVPDGVLDLDRVEDLAFSMPELEPVTTPSRLITFADIDMTPCVHTVDGLVASALSCLSHTRLPQGAHLITLMPPDDLVSLSTGLVAALLSGATLNSHGLFHGPALAASLKQDGPLHLVAPSWLEEKLGRALDVLEQLSAVFVHKIPFDCPAPRQSKASIVDLLPLNEVAVLPSPRRADGTVRFSLDSLTSPQKNAPPFLTFRCDENSHLYVSGPAADHHTVDLVPKEEEQEEDPWIDTGLKAEVENGMIVKVVPA